MKTKLIFLVLLIVCFSCGTNNKPVSDAQKEKIKGEVKEVVNTGFKGCEEINFDLAINPFVDSPDFVFTNNENSFDYKQFADAVKRNFSILMNQKITINEEKYVFLDKSTVIYTLKGKNIANFKDGHSTFSDPLITQFTFKKIDNKWKVINLVQTSVNKPIKNTETLKELNQVELIKQLLGSWRCEVAKDTTGVADYKSYGTGLEGYIKYMTKGKIFMEAKQLWGFNKKDEGIGVQMTKGIGAEIYAFWWTSKNKYFFIPYSEISNPEKANFKDEGEIKSPDIFVSTITETNKPVKTNTWTRVK